MIIQYCNTKVSKTHLTSGSKRQRNFRETSEELQRKHRTVSIVQSVTMSSKKQKPRHNPRVVLTFTTNTRVPNIQTSSRAASRMSSREASRVSLRVSSRGPSRASFTASSRASSREASRVSSRGRCVTVRAEVFRDRETAQRSVELPDVHHKILPYFYTTTCSKT